MTANERTVCPGMWFSHAGHRCQVVRVYPWSQTAPKGNADGIR